MELSFKVSSPLVITLRSQSETIRSHVSHTRIPLVKIWNNPAAVNKQLKRDRLSKKSMFNDTQNYLQILLTESSRLVPYLSAAPHFYNVGFVVEQVEEAFDVPGAGIR